MMMKARMVITEWLLIDEDEANDVFISGWTEAEDCEPVSNIIRRSSTILGDPRKSPKGDHIYVN